MKISTDDIEHNYSTPSPPLIGFGEMTMVIVLFTILISEMVEIEQSTNIQKLEVRRELRVRAQPEDAGPRWASESAFGFVGT